MEFFTGALLITLGVLTAFAILWMLFNVAKLAFAVWVHKKKKEFQKGVDKARAVRTAARRAAGQKQLAVELENAEVREVFEALQKVPYSYKETKAAKKQNYARQKLQAQLRKLVPNANTREMLYEQAK